MYVAVGGGVWGVGGGRGTPEQITEVGGSVGVSEGDRSRKKGGSSPGQVTRGRRKIGKKVRKVKGTERT